MATKMKSMYGERLKEIREKLGIIQVDFCKQFGITRSTLINYENGKTYFDVEFLDRFCKAYNINLAWLVTGSGEMYRQEEDKSNNPEYLARLLYGEDGMQKDIKEILAALKDKILRSEVTIALEIARQKHKNYISSNNTNNNVLQGGAS